MKITGISLRVPERAVTNDEIADEARRRSVDSFAGDIDQTIRELRKLFSRSGIETRHYLGDNEPWYPHVSSAISDSMDQAGLSAGDVDCVMYASVFRTMLEPSMASLIARDFGMRRAAAFDVNEACGSWGRAAFLAQSLLDSGAYKNILIVTAEANARFQGYGSLAGNLKTHLDLNWAFPSYTIGCGFTATVLSADDQNSDPQPWEITYTADNDLADLCLFPLSWPTDSDFQMGDLDTSGQGTGIFTCYGNEMQSKSTTQFVRFLYKSIEDIRSADIFLPHTQTYKAYAHLMRFLGVSQKKLFSVYPALGNVVTCSLPATIARAVDAGRLNRGDRVFMAMPASGLSMSTYSFTY